MTATPARIGLITQQFRTVEAKDPAVQARYGKDARDTGAEPVETFFDDMADVQAVCDERLKLLKRDYRRFRQTTNNLVDFTGALDFSQKTPAATVIDTDRGANLKSAIVEISLDSGGNKTTIVTWGSAESADALTIAGDTVTAAAAIPEMI